MIRLKSDKDINILRAGGKRLAVILAELETKVKSGVTTGELDDYAQELIATGGDRAAFLNYRPRGSRLAYPAALCVSVNEEIVHGLPGKRRIADGDIVSLDLGLVHDNLVTDSAVSVIAGCADPETEKLLGCTKEALALGIAAARAEGTTGDIGAAVEKYVLAQGFGVVRDLSGHGVGFNVHEDPEVPNYGRPGEGEQLAPGLVIAIEPMVVAGTEETRLLADGFTFVTADGARAAHFEHTIVVTDSGPEILTQ